MKNKKDLQSLESLVIVVTSAGFKPLVVISLFIGSVLNSMFCVDDL